MGFGLVLFKINEHLNLYGNFEFLRLLVISVEVSGFVVKFVASKLIGQHLFFYYFLNFFCRNLKAYSYERLSP